MALVASDSVFYADFILLVYCPHGPFQLVEAAIYDIMNPRVVLRFIAVVSNLSECSEELKLLREV